MSYKERRKQLKKAKQKMLLVIYIILFTVLFLYAGKADYEIELMEAGTYNTEVVQW